MAHRTKAVALAVLVSLAGADAASAGRQQTTELISRAVDGGTPNGPSTRAVISGDRRYSRIVAFQSTATDLVRGDTNGHEDVFVVPRAGSVNNQGTAWSGEDTILVSRGLDGEPANGPSSGASVSGDFRSPGRCIAFLSAASNLVSGDDNGRTDAFLVSAPGGAPRRVGDAPADADSVSVSGDCSRVSFTAGGDLYTSVRGGDAKRVSTVGNASDPSYATGNSNALVYTARGGVWLSPNGTTRGQLEARGGRNPVFNDLKRRTLAYEKTFRGRTQIGYRDVNRGEKVISSRGRRRGNGNSRNPVIGNSGFYVTFETDATNFGLTPSQRTGDSNGRPDSYLYTDAREITLVQSVFEQGVPMPGGGSNPSMSFYANYIVFDSPGRDPGNQPQVYMRWLGAV
jgi:hypothetical protein